MTKFNWNTPNDEIERILHESTKKDIEETHKLGLPVRTVDEVGVSRRKKGICKVVQKGCK